MIPLSFSSLTRSPPSGAASSSSSSSSSTSSSSSSSSNPTSSSSSTATSFLSYRSSSSSSLPSFLPTVLSRDSEAPSASSQPRRGISASSSSSLHLGSKTKGLWGRENTGPARTGRESPSEGQNEAEKDEEEKKDGGGERKLDAGARPRKTTGEGGKENKLTVRAERFHAVLAKPDVDLQELRHLLWSGVPACCPRWIRSDSWRLVLGYLPLNRDRIHHVLKKRRSEYTELLQHYYHKETLSLDESKLLRQLRVDLPRTHSGLHFFSHARIQRCMERALFLWAVKNPASGYVQGINDLITPFISVFLESSLGQDPETASIDEIPSDILNEVEADSFWCLSKLLAHIQVSLITSLLVSLAFKNRFSS
ncbi:tbc domain containing protein [Cystoisospora suis]|uniref:Tbc domain containing protein n=1 Tax=Cystoisospora suis TaxID=483139 RepID=A0A2C6LDV2_9APIC|nr:tbc domain containing protein [Cystoisospora suis]